MILKRYWIAEWEGTMQPWTEAEEFDDYESVQQAIFMYKLADACTGYEIYDLDMTQYEIYSSDYKAWQQLKHAKIESWYDKGALAGKKIGGNTMRQNMMNMSDYMQP